MDRGFYSTRDVIELLRGEGWAELTADYIEYLLKNGHVSAPGKLGRVRAWTGADVDRLRGFLQRRGERWRNRLTE